MKMKRTHGALALSLIFITHLGSCDTTGRSYVMLPLDSSEPPPPCGPLCSTCSRECAPLPAKDFIGPYLLWYGEDASDAVCPEHAPTIVFRGHSGLLPMARNRCVACYCTPGRCVFPEGISASETSDCEGLEDQPLDAQNIWLDPTGSVTVSSPESVREILSSQPAALFVPPASIASCTPMMDAPLPPRIELLPWQHTGVVCSGIPRDDECRDASTTCVPVEEDYAQCILYRGSKTYPECPSPYPEKLVLYRGVQSTRGCTTCDCGPPEGGECAARVLALWQKDHPTVASFTTVTREEPGCVERNPRMQIASLQAGWLTNHPASCLVSGGERTGGYGPKGAQVLCCQTPPVPRKRQAAVADPDAGSGDP